MAVRLDSTSADFEKRFSALLAAKREVSEDVDHAVRDIIETVRAEGDHALIDFSRKFDRVDLGKIGLRVTQAEIDAAAAAIDAETQSALEIAHDRIRSHHQRQLPSDEQYTDALGVELGWRWSAIEAVGLYVPGGSASYPRSVLMNAVPARVAGVERRDLTLHVEDASLRREHRPVTLLEFVNERLFLLRGGSVSKLTDNVIALRHHLHGELGRFRIDLTLQHSAESDKELAEVFAESCRCRVFGSHPSESL